MSRQSTPFNVDYALAWQRACFDGDFTWLGVAIVVGSMVSLVYYLRVIAAVWMQAGPGPSTKRQPQQ